MFVYVLLKIVSRATEVISRTMMGKCPTRESRSLPTGPVSVEDNSVFRGCEQRVKPGR